MRSSKKSGRQKAVVGFNLGHKFLGRRRTQCIGNQVHVQSEYITGLRVAPFAFSVGIVDLPKRGGAVVRSGDESIVMYELLLEGGADLFEQVFLVLFIGVVRE